MYSLRAGIGWMLISPGPFEKHDNPLLSIYVKKDAKNTTELVVIYIAFNFNIYFKTMSEKHSHYPVCDRPRSGRFTPPRYIPTLLMVLLALAGMVGPAAAAGSTIVTNITPATGFNTTTVSITDLAGTNFLLNATVMLTPVDLIPVHKGSIVNGSGGALLNHPVSVFVSGTYAYVASSGSNALEIVNVADPAIPVHAGYLADGGVVAPCLSRPYAIYVSGNYTYMTSAGDNALEIVNVTDPANPIHTGNLDDGGGVAPFLNDAQSIFVSGNYAYVASPSDNTLEIVDVTDPAIPVHKSSIANGSGGALLTWPVNVYVSGTYAYVASDGSNALEIVDIGTITATSVNVATPTNITCTFNLTGAVPGMYNVVVTNPDGSFGTLAGGFTVIGSTPTPTPTPTPTVTPTTTPVPTQWWDGGSDSDTTPGPTRAPKITITVNVGGDSSVYRANVTGTGISGLILTGFVASGPGQGIPPAPETVYEYVDLLPARFYIIEQANISFTVPQSWLDKYQLSQKNIMVYHLTNTTWTALPTMLVKTETVRSYYMATSPGFSRFAITGNITVTSGTLVQAPDSVLQTSGSAAQAAAVPELSVTSPEPAAVQTTEAPAVQTATRPPSGLPVTIIGMGIAGVIILAGLVMLVRRWWIRKQNPSLFRDQK